MPEDPSMASAFGSRKEEKRMPMPCLHRFDGWMGWQESLSEGDECRCSDCGVKAVWRDRQWRIESDA